MIYYGLKCLQKVVTKIAKRLTKTSSWKNINPDYEQFKPEHRDFIKFSYPSLDPRTIETLADSQKPIKQLVDNITRGLLANFSKFVGMRCKIF